MRKDSARQGRCGHPCARTLRGRHQRPRDAFRRAARQLAATPESKQARAATTRSPPIPNLTLRFQLAPLRFDGAPISRSTSQKLMFAGTVLWPRSVLGFSCAYAPKAASKAKPEDSAYTILPRQLPDIGPISKTFKPFKPLNIQSFQTFKSSTPRTLHKARPSTTQTIQTLQTFKPSSIDILKPTDLQPHNYFKY